MLGTRKVGIMNSNYQKRPDYSYMQKQTYPITQARVHEAHIHTSLKYVKAEIAPVLFNMP